MTKANGTAIADALRATDAEPVTPLVLPLTPEQRQAAFLEAFAALEKKFGVTVIAQMKPRILGEVVQVEAQAVIALINDWKAD